MILTRSLKMIHDGDLMKRRNGVLRMTSDWSCDGGWRMNWSHSEKMRNDARSWSETCVPSRNGGCYSSLF